LRLVKETLYQEENNIKRKSTQYVLWFVLDNILRLLHPFMPFITEEIWQKIPHNQVSISIASWPSYKKERIKRSIEEKVVIIQGVIKTIRNIKAEMNIPLTKSLDVYMRVVDKSKEKLLEENLLYIKNLAHLNYIHIGSDLEKPECSATGVLEDIEIFVPLENVIDIKAEIERLEKKLLKIEKEITLINKKLKNVDFIQKAPVNVIDKEKEKIKELTDIRDRIVKNLKTIQ